MMKFHDLMHQPVEFLDQNDMPVPINKPTLILSQTVKYVLYIEWLVTVQDRLNEALHPALPGSMQHFFYSIWSQTSSETIVYTKL